MRWWSLCLLALLGLCVLWQQAGAAEAEVDAESEDESKMPLLVRMKRGRKTRQTKYITANLYL